MSEEPKFEPKVYIDVAQEREKPRLIAILFFDFSNQTVEGKHNLLGVFDRIIVPPARKRAHPIGMFIKTAHTFADVLQIAIFGPDNKPVGGFSYISEKQEHEGKTLTQMQIIGTLEFDTPEPGAYWVDVSYGEQSLGGVRIMVEFAAAEAKEGANVNE